MSASELLFVIVRETGAANALVGHLRAASCAATALRGIANGQDEPRQG